MNEVFRALADPTRRGLLDELLRQDGQTLSELSNRLTMTRFGVMKHLRILEDAGLVVTRKEGREKLHFISAVPIQQLPEHWIDKYRGQSVSKSLDRSTEKSYEYYIKTTPERLWGAIIGQEQRWKYSFGVQVHTDWQVGSRYVGLPMSHPELRIFEGENLEVEPGVRLVQSYRALWSDEVKALGTSRVSWLIDRIEDTCRLTLLHDQLPQHPNSVVLYGGWPMLLSGLKTLLETGEMLTTPASIQYFGATNTDTSPINTVISATDTNSTSI
ncbi:MAG: metalloregulator ArsR/SmtB family transcription factor [Gemmatimonadaceae bacterium]